MFNKKPDSNDLKDWVLNWERLNPDVKQTLELLKEQYGCEKAVEMYTEMHFMDLLAKKQKREKEKNDSYVFCIGCVSTINLKSNTFSNECIHSSC